MFSGADAAAYSITIDLRNFVAHCWPLSVLLFLCPHAHSCARNSFSHRLSAHQSRQWLQFSVRPFSLFSYYTLYCISELAHAKLNKHSGNATEMGWLGWDLNCWRFCRHQLEGQRERDVGTQGVESVSASINANRNICNIICGGAKVADWSCLT